MRGPVPLVAAVALGTISDFKLQISEARGRERRRAKAALTEQHRCHSSVLCRSFGPPPILLRSSSALPGQTTPVTAHPGLRGLEQDVSATRGKSARLPARG